MPTSIPPGLLRPHHLALKVRDLEAVERFYAGVLGLPILRRLPDVSGAPRSIWLEAGGTILMLERSAAAITSSADGEPFAHDPPGWHLLALGIDPTDRAAWKAHLAACGVPVVQESAYSLYMRDPEGNRVALSHYPTPASSAPEAASP